MSFVFRFLWRSAFLSLGLWSLLTVQVLAAPQHTFITGKASYYGPNFHGQCCTANGERVDMYALTAAHPSLPFGTLVRVTNLNNHKSVIVRINDRGSFGHKRVIDLSLGAFQKIASPRKGVIPVRLEILNAAPTTPAAPAAKASAEPESAPPFLEALLPEMQLPAIRS